MCRPLSIRDAASRASTGATYLNLCNSGWRTLRITEQRWDIEALRPFHKDGQVWTAVGEREPVTAVTVTGASISSPPEKEIFSDVFLHFVREIGTRLSYSSPRNHAGGVECR